LGVSEARLLLLLMEIDTEVVGGDVEIGGSLGSL
jgi:hypothetical protein